MPRTGILHWIHELGNTSLIQVEDLDVSVLVNNVGLEVLSAYHELKEEKLKNIVTVNTLPMTVFAHKFIQRFLKRNKRSAMINLSSVSGEIPNVGYHIYSSTKAYDDFLSRALSYEYPNIDIMSLRPSEVSTTMTSNKPLDIMTITTETCVEAALGDLGYERVTNGHWNHKIQSWMTLAVP